MRQVFIKVPNRTRKGYRKVKVASKLVEKYKLLAGMTTPFTQLTLTGRR